MPTNTPIKKLGESEIEKAKGRLSDEWQIVDSGRTLKRTAQFKGYNKTIGFVNALAWQANKANHHPDLFVSFKECVVHLTTHDVSGLSEKDFALAETVDWLLAPNKNGS